MIRDLNTNFAEYGRKALCALAVVLLMTSTLNAQEVTRRYPYHRPYWGWRHYYGPSDAISNRIRAQAEWVAAVSVSARNQAIAAQERAKANRMEIENTVLRAKAYWDRKEIYQAAKLREYTAPLDAADLRNSKTWRRLKDHPEWNGSAIENGKALNFLLDRLSGSLLLTQFSQSQVDQGLLNRLRLTADTLGKLRVREDLPGDRGLVFVVNSGESLDVQMWPYSLRADHFKRHREAFENARAALREYSSSDEAEKNQLFKNLLQAHGKLEQEFYSFYTKEDRVRFGGRDFPQFRRSQLFLKSLALEMSRLQELGPQTETEESLRFDGDNLIALVEHMSRHGLEFAPAHAGEEAAYDKVFSVMRDLYLKVNDE